MQLSIATEFDAPFAAEQCRTPPPTGLALTEQALCLAPSKGMRHEGRSPPSPRGPKAQEPKSHQEPMRTQTLAPRFASRTRGAH